MGKRLLVLIIAFFCVTGSALEIQNSGFESKNTKVTPVLDCEISSNQNLLYSCSFQLAWNEFNKDAIVYSGSEMEKRLNKRSVTKSVLSDRYYFIGVARDKKELKKMNESLIRKFGPDSPGEVKEDLDGGTLIYSFFKKSLQFKKDFNEIKGGMRFGGKQVKTFGIQGFRPQLHAGLEKQVRIVDYRNPDDFIVVLNSTSTNDEIVVAKIGPKTTLLSTFMESEKRIGKSHPESLHHADLLYIPQIFLDIEKNYSELLGGGITKAYQWTKFTLNQWGAAVVSEARIVYKDGGYERSFIFNKPFLIYLKEKGQKYPYFALWVNNPEILIEEK